LIFLSLMIISRSFYLTSLEMHISIF